MLVSIALASIPAFLVAAPPAYAAGPTISKTAELRDCVRLDIRKECKARGEELKPKTPVKMFCWLDGKDLSGSKRWFYISDKKKRYGFVHSSLVKNQAKVGSCKKRRDVSASAWAAEHVGKKEPTRGEVDKLNITDNQWSGWCAAFTRGAYLLGMKKADLKFLGENARQRYAWYQSKRLVHSMTTTPTVGSQIFWTTIGGEFGHVAIYVGNGYMVTTVGLPDSTPKAIIHVPYRGYAGTNPAGWVHANDA